MTSSLSVHVNDDCGPPANSAKFELFHAPSFGDEDFELTSGAASYPSSATRPDVISSNLSTSATLLSSTASPGVSEVTSGRLHASPTTTTGTEEMASLHRPEVSPCCNYGNVMPSGHRPMIGMQPQGDAGSGYCLQQNSAPLMTSSQPSLQCSGIITSNNNNNNNNGNIDSSTVDFRALDRQSFTPPFVMTSFGRQYYDRSSQFPQAHHGYGYSNQQQQQQQQRQLASAYELTMMNDRNCETVHSQQQRHLQMQSVPDQIQIAAAMRCGLVPPSAANTAVGPHQNSPIALGSVCSENALDSGASGRLNPMAGFYQPRPETCEDSSAVAKKPKSSKKRKKKDSNEPQKPVSAYALFFRDTQAAIKSHNPSASFGEMSKIVAAMWDSLDDLNKNIYRKRTEMAKKLYLKQLATYRASQLTKTDDVSSGQQTHVTSASPAVTPDTTTKSPGLTIGNAPSQQPQQQVAMVTGNGNPQQTSPLVHLSVDTGSRQMAQLPPPSYSLLTSSSLLTQQPTMTSRYRDAYGSALMAGNNNHLIHSTPTSSLYHHGLHVDTSMPPYPSAPGATAVGMAGNCNSQIGFGAVHSTTGHDEVRWNYYDVAHPPPKCDYPQASPAWWIR